MISWSECALGKEVVGNRIEHRTGCRNLASVGDDEAWKGRMTNLASALYVPCEHNSPYFKWLRGNIFLLRGFLLLNVN